MRRAIVEYNTRYVRTFYVHRVPAELTSLNKEKKTANNRTKLQPQMITVYLE
jgi:hypothetical protein